MEDFIMKDYARRVNESIRDWADRVNGKPNINKVHCIFDNTELASGQGFALCLPETGTLPRYHGFCFRSTAI